MKNILPTLGMMLFAHLCTAQIVYVDSSAVLGLNTGDTWENAFTDLQSALQSTPSAQEIWVAKGTYFPTTDDNREIYFQLESGVRLIGGFEGNETEISQRDWTENKTILSGNIGMLEDTTDNSYTILYAMSTDTMTMIDGFVFDGGNSDNDDALVNFMSHKKNGGAIYLNGNVSYAAINVLNCEFKNNNARYGGAVYLNGINGSTGAKFNNCAFESNTANSGGAIYQSGAVTNYFGNKIIGCTFKNNFVEIGYGGAIFFQSIAGAVEYHIQDCSFIENRTSVISSHGGGAIAYYNSLNYSENKFFLDHCLFEKNYSDEGGAIFFFHSFLGEDALHINACEFIENTCIISIIEINSSLDGSEDFTVRNSLFKENKEDFVFRGPISEFSNCIFDNNTDGVIRIQPPIEGVFDTEFNNCVFFTDDPANSSRVSAISEVSFNNSIFYNGFAETDTFISSGSPIAFNNCLMTLPACDAGVLSFNDSLLVCNNMLLNVDPLFKDAANGDFSLSACSPAIDAGDNTLISLLDIPSDIAGNERITNDAIDLGAYESPIPFLINSLTPVSCYGENTGAVFPVFNGVEPFDYAWTNGQTNGSQLDNLEAGFYSLTVTDANACSDTIAFEISESPQIVTEFLSQSTSCYNGIDGYALAVNSGGVSPFTVQWESGETGEEAFLLSAGYNMVSITDANDCLKVDSVFINEPTPINVAGEITNASATSTEDGSIEIIDVLGGTPPYSFLWSNGETTALIENLQHGDYTLTVTDANGCVFSVGFLVSFLDAILTPEEAGIQIFPNPVSVNEDIQIARENHPNFKRLSFYDSLGRLFKEIKEVEQNVNPTHVKSPDQKGIYLLKIEYDNEVFIKKIIVLE